MYIDLGAVLLYPLMGFACGLVALLFAIGLLPFAMLALKIKDYISNKGE